MANTQELTQKLEIINFKEKFLETFGLNVYVYIEQPAKHRISLDVFLNCAMIALKKNEPEYSSLKDLTSRNRYKNYLIYVQSMSYIAFKEGHTQSKIARSLGRTHATVINSIRQVEDAFATKESMMIKAFNNILKEIETYVGTIPENFKREVISKPKSDPIWNEARHFIASNFTNR